MHSYFYPNSSFSNIHYRKVIIPKAIERVIYNHFLLTDVFFQLKEGE